MAKIIPPLMGKSFERIVRKFIGAGMHLSSPVDLIPPGKFPYLKNTRSYLNSPLQGRPGIVRQFDIAGVGTGLCHSMRRLNDDTVAYGGFTRIFGIGTGLYSGAVGSPAAVSGAGPFSGNPLTMVEFRPPESATPWLYLGDSLLNWKVNSTGVGRPLGYKPPAPAPTVAFAVSASGNANPTYPQASIAHTFINNAANSDEVAGDWAQSGTAGGPTLLTGATGRINAGAVTITALTYDSEPPRS